MSWEEWIIGCGVVSVCTTAIVWRSKGAGRLGGAEKRFLILSYSIIDLYTVENCKSQTPVM